MSLKYESQRVALYYFVGALVLFLVQIGFGLLAGTIYAVPNFLTDTVPFNIVRMIHTNALIVWILMGFMGATYYLLPEEVEAELYSTKLAVVQFVLFFLGGLTAVVSYLMGIHGGREFLEQPLPVKLGIVVVAVIFLVNITLTLRKGRRTSISSILVFGLWGTVVFFLFALWNPTNLVIDKTFWWWVVHLWVEGVWELVLAAVLAFLLIKMTGVDREIVEKWMYVVVGLALFSGILGTGHHYYWIGTPGYWQGLGSVFSALEVLPFFGLVIFAFRMVQKGGRRHRNKAALTWSLGCSVLAFLGAGVWGFLHTLAPVNFYTHGTQLTAAHGHLAFYGAYAVINIAIMTYAFPHLLGRRPYNQLLNRASFWVTSIGVVVMTFALTFAGVMQSYLQRVMGMDFMVVQEQLALFNWIRLGAGVFVAIGVVMLVVSLLVPGLDSGSSRGLGKETGFWGRW